MCILTAFFGLAGIVILLAALAGNNFDLPAIAGSTTTITITQLLFAILLNVLSLLGVYLMWTLRKAGFYLFFVTRVLLYYLPLFFSSTEHPALNELFVTALVMMLFGINLGIMQR